MNLKQKLPAYHTLSISIGLVYLWFGILKFFPGLSPADELAKQTIAIITFNLIPPKISIIVLAFWETLIGVCLVFNIYRKKVVVIALIHLVLTFTPFLFFPELCFVNVPYQFTLLGQYIFKNLVIIAALIAIYYMPCGTKKSFRDKA